MLSAQAGAPLGRHDVIGRELTEILQAARLNDDGMDWVYSYFRLDSGATFILPCDDAGGLPHAEPPPECEPLTIEDVGPILRQRIVKVLRQGRESEWFHDIPYLVLENGYAVTDVMAYPTGPAYAGLHIYRPGEIDISTMLEFFEE